MFDDDPHDGPGPEPPSASDAPAELRAEFWATVLLANVAVLGLVVGPVALVARPGSRVGEALTAGGVVAALLTYRRYRRVRARRDAGEFSE